MPTLSERFRNWLLQPPPTTVESPKAMPEPTIDTMVVSIAPAATADAAPTVSVGTNSASFERAFERTIGHEGGYVNNPKDPGGETRYGVSKRTYPNEDIKNMTLARSKFLYLRDFWLPIHGDDLPPALASDVFDAAINHGPGNAIRMLQSAIGVVPDGGFGPISKAALARETNVAAVQARFLGYRLLFMADISTWQTFGKGWARRVGNNLKDVR